MYHRVIKEYSLKAYPLNNMLKKKLYLNWNHLMEELYAAFHTHEEKLINPQILALPNMGGPYMIDMDASACQLSAVLIQ